MTVDVLGMPLITGSMTPRDFQLEDLRRLAPHPRVNIWNDLGTGKTPLTAWWLQSQWMRGVVDFAVFVIPGMCFPDWRWVMSGGAWPEGMAEVHDCRPGMRGVGFIRDEIFDGSCWSSALRCYFTTYSGLRDLGCTGQSRGRWSPDDEVAAELRGRRWALVLDESQAAALPTSGQGMAGRHLAAHAAAVASVTATPIGNPLQMRLWGEGRLVRPDAVSRPSPLRGTRAAPGSFQAFKERYGVLQDPSLRAREEQWEQRGRVGHAPGPIWERSFPVAINQGRIQDEVIGRMAPFTVNRRKADVLDLPEKIHMTRWCRLPDSAMTLLRQLVEEDRAILESGSVVVIENVLEERLRTIELCGGWLAGEPVHGEKLSLLVDVVEELRGAEGELVSFCVWVPRTRELLGAALVVAGVPVPDAMRLATDGANGGPAYARCIEEARRGFVGIIHGPTPQHQRDSVQASWKRGALRAVVAHPGVAGAGLNWQHSKAAIYMSPPLGVIARQQSEDRMHRIGLDHSVLYYDLVVEDGPDEAVVRAHRQQRDVATALLDWLRETSRG